MALRFLTCCVFVLRTSAIFLLVIGGLSSAAHAQNYGWAMNPAYQPYRPYTSPSTASYSYRDQNQNYLASLQAVPTNGQQSDYPLPAQAPPSQSCASCGNDSVTYGCDSCASGSTCLQDCCAPTPVWGGYAGGVWLNRQDENHHTFSYDGSNGGANEDYQLLDSRDSNFDDGFGVEVHLIRRNPCCCTAWEGVYWGVYPEDSYSYAYQSQVTGDNLNAILNFDQLNYNGGLASVSANGAEVHRLRRETEIHNVELNHLWELSPRGGSFSPWTFQALAGFRYFRFVDNLQFASDPTDTVFTGAAEELYYTIDVDNDLFGFQLGGLFERQCKQSRWSLTCGAKVGVFVNDANAHSVIGGSAGTATVENGPNIGLAFDITSDKDDLALLAELQAGIAYRVSRNWRLRGEYRVLGVSGVALPTNQIYQDLRGLQDVQFLATNGDLILHGAFFGAEWGY